LKIIKAGQMVFSYPIGVATDIVGRKPILLIGLLGSCVFTAGLLRLIAQLSLKKIQINQSAFGFAPTFPLALVFRTICGSLNGIVSVTKTTLSEITDSTNQGRAFAIMGLFRAIGIIVGPAVGGFLAQVSDKVHIFFKTPYLLNNFLFISILFIYLKYPSLFPRGSLFDVFPFALPCIVGATISGLGFLACWFCLEETKIFPSSSSSYFSASSPSSSSGQSKDHSASSSSPFLPGPALPFPPHPCESQQQQEQSSSSSGLYRERSQETLHLLSSARRVNSYESFDNLSEVRSPYSDRGTLRPESPVDFNEDDDDNEDVAEEGKRCKSKKKSAKTMSVLEILSDVKIGLSIFLYAFISGLYIQYVSLSPSFAFPLFPHVVFIIFY
jgi:hypothetical protein